MYTSFVLCTRTTICSHLPVLQNLDSLLEGLVIDRDRTKISNIVQSSPLPRLATEPGGTSTPPQKPRTRDCYRRTPRTKPEIKSRGLVSHAPNARLPPSPRTEQKPEPPLLLIRLLPCLLPTPLPRTLPTPRHGARCQNPIMGNQKPTGVFEPK